MYDTHRVTSCKHKCLHTGQTGLLASGSGVDDPVSLLLSDGFTVLMCVSVSRALQWALLFAAALTQHLCV